MIPKECKRLAEVDFPIARVSAHSAREKSIRHGHPSTLHLWWARRPLAACRSMLMALLLPDPCDPHCPAEFRKRARAILSTPAETGTALMSIGKKDEDLRKGLLDFIADFANWDNSSHPVYLKASRALVKAAHGDEAPLVVDPFAGGGSIPLEALRIGCDAFASDLNPVACLINKVMLEDIPRHGPKLAEELRRVGAEIKKQAEKELAEFYPPDPDGARPIAYLWARTVKCEQPNCGCEIPLLRSLWLCKKAERRRALRPNIVREEGKLPRVEFELFVPKSDHEVEAGYAANGKARCPNPDCAAVLSGIRVRSQLANEHGGGSPEFNAAGERVGGAMLIAVVTVNDTTSGRSYRLAVKQDYEPCLRVARRPISDSPTEQINAIRPSPNARGLSAVTRFGISTFADLYSRRQLESVTALSRIIAASAPISSRRALALAVGRVSNAWTSVSRWHQTRETVEGAFNGQKIPMVWDFAEAMPLGGATGGWDSAVDWVGAVAEKVSAFPTVGQVQQSDAAKPVLSEQSAAAWFTDPPYYDAVPYADLSDFFLVWLRRALPELEITDPYTATNKLSPKTEECVWNQSWKDNEGNAKTPAFFERKFSLAAATGRKTLRDDGVGCVVFAHKSTEGWESLLTGLIAGGFVISASWPIITEMAEHTNARGTASLMGSVHLVCRPRDEAAGVGDWGEIIRELPQRIGNWMERLGNEGIHGADLVFACIGPALELFSRYERVETPDGEEVGLAANDKARGEPARRGFLSYVWEVAGRTALNQVLGSAESNARNGAAGALEEDARLTALFLWTLQATETAANDNQNRAREEADEDDDAEEAEDEDTGAGKDKSQTRRGEKKAGLTLIYDVARRFAQPLGIHLDAWEGRIIGTAKGIVRLLPVHERAKQLFGEEGSAAVARKFESERRPNPQAMFDFMAEARAAAVPEVKGRGRRKANADADAESLKARQQATTLDRVHAAMLLQSSGASNALRALLEAETQRGPDFLRLANALSALYPRDSEEKRLLDAMLLALPR